LFNKYKIDDYERESFTPIMKESGILNKKINPVFRVSENIDVDITEEANRGNYDLLLMGIGQSIFKGSTLGNILGYTLNVINPDWVLDKLRSKNSPDYVLFDERTRKILSRTRIPVGVLLNKGFKNIHKLLIPVFTARDAFMLEFAKKLAVNTDVQITIWDLQGNGMNDTNLKELIQILKQDVQNPERIEVTNKIDPARQFDLMLVSSDGWKKQDFFKKTPSVLILRK
jgi:hypothetical protein